MHQPILVLNAGSSSCKFSVFEAKPDNSLTLGPYGQVDGLGAGAGKSAQLEAFDTPHDPPSQRVIAGTDYESAVAAIHDWFVTNVGSERALYGIGHRVVHGGEAYSAPIFVDDSVIENLEKFIPLAPLHQPHNIAAIRAFSTIASNVSQVACFDTAFHRHQPPIAQQFALPRRLTAKGLHKYGFHGLSYEYIVSALPGIAPECATGKIIVAHLGNGASMCAIDGGHSVATTMGLTALDGLPMGTRSGSLDPGVILYLLQSEGMDAHGIEQLLYEQSGLLGVSALSSDMRTLLESKLPTAAEAVDLFVYRIGREIGSLTAALGELDAIVFTGGIGEHAVPIRARVCDEARWLGVELNETANAAGGPRISSLSHAYQLGSFQPMKI